MLLLALLSTIMFFFCLYLYYDNKKLKDKVEKLELDIKEVLDKKLTPSKEDIIPIDSISKEVKEEQIITKKEQQIETNTKDTIIPSSYTNEKYTAKPTIEEYIKPKIAKPTELTLTKTTKPLEKTQTIITTSFEPLDFIKREKLTITDIKKKNNTSYLNEISKQLDSIASPQTINLTDYEKEQEEHAIISYQELLSLKEKSNNDKKEDEYFVEDLKEFYSLLD